MKQKWTKHPVLKLKSIYILGLILIVLLIVVGFFWFLGLKNQNQKPAVDVKQSDGEFKVDKKYISNNETLAGFPENFPKEISGRIIENSESMASDGRLQSTKKFTSRLPAQQALQKYADFFKSLGWKSNTSTPTELPTLFTKDQNILMIITRTDATSKDTVVEISIIQRNITAVK